MICQEIWGLTGLYDYNARWYDPGTGRFVSADTIVPTEADNQSIQPLTVSFSETALLSRLAQERAGLVEELHATGPSSPQNLARYAYVLNSPTGYTDPDGHEAIPNLVFRKYPDRNDRTHTIFEIYQDGQLVFRQRAENGSLAYDVIDTLWTDAQREFEELQNYRNSDEFILQLFDILTVILAVVSLVLVMQPRFCKSEPLQDLC